MPSGPSNQESEPLLPIHHANHIQSGNPISTNPIISTTPTRSKLSARRYIQSSSPFTLKDKGKGKAKLQDDGEIDLEKGLLDDHDGDDAEDEFHENHKEKKNKKNKGKGKGKGKEDKRGRNITIIFSNESDLTGNGNLECWIEDGENVGSLKDQIKTLRPSLQSYNLRLIHSGRLLTDGILLIPWLKSLEDRFKRQTLGVGGDVENVLKEVGLTEDLSESSSSYSSSSEIEDEDIDENQARNVRKQKKREKLNKDSTAPNEKVWLHCIVGGKEEKIKTTEDEENEPSAPRRRGFDVLLDAGLSADDVAAMRRQFYESRGEEVPEGMEGGDVNDEHARSLEEQWIEGDLTAETATTTTEGLYSSILHGLLTGFLFPIIPWFFFKEPPLPNFFDADAEAIAISLRSNSNGIASSVTNNNNNGETAASSSSSSLFPNPGLTPTDSTTNNNTTTTTTPAISAQDRFMRAGGIGIGSGEIIASQVFGKRMQMGILLGTILNIAFGALRFLN
ncbi:uncharacterized protein L201_003468 [Kwoniella dendrophila CBS 6074]|uniref:Ubiquitin-like domain-containing protein n=1 Tax=Kwoniella dendrophila CBS 6074 TaxID=1295534 RepID=A0AAX4JVG0_9TREE